ncbi:MAG: hypothetical protein U0519_02685 [Candidatus Gracilibacteria bacterium]
MLTQGPGEQEQLSLNIGYAEALQTIAAFFEVKQEAAAASLESIREDLRFITDGKKFEDARFDLGWVFDGKSYEKHLFVTCDNRGPYHFSLNKGKLVSHGILTIEDFEDQLKNRPQAGETVQLPDARISQRIGSVLDGDSGDLDEEGDLVLAGRDPSEMPTASTRKLAMIPDEDAGFRSLAEDYVPAPTDAED